MLDDINEFINLYQRETNLEKKIKKLIFIAISTILPLLEIILVIYEIYDIFLNLNIKENLTPIEIYSFPIFLCFCTLSSLFCSWYLISICFNNIRSIITLLLLFII